MKKFLPLLSLSLLPVFTQAQDFVFTQDTAFLYTSGHDSEFVTCYNTIENITSETFNYEWRFINAEEIPSGWSFFGYCDNMTCRIPGVPVSWETGASVVNIPIEPRVVGDNKLQINIPTSAPNATVLFQVEIKSPNQTDTAYFFISKVPTSVENVTLEQQGFTLYPNPANNTLNIGLSSDLMNGKIAIYNVLGQLMMEQNINNNHVQTIDISKIQSGNYFVKMINKEGISIGTKSFVKK